ncbi:MAG: ATP-binding protein [Flavobacteriaceae bacterium]
MKDPKLILILLFFPSLFYAQKDTISNDSIKVLIKKTFEDSYAYDYKSAIITAGVIIEETIKKGDHFNTSAGYNRLGSIYTDLKDTLNGLEYYNKALEYARLTKQDTFIAGVYNDIGNLYMESGGSVEKAKENFKKSLELNLSGNRSEKGLLANYINIAWTHINLNELDKAFPYLNKAKSIVSLNPSLHPLYGINLDILFGRYHYYKNIDIDLCISIFEDISKRAEKGNFLNQVVEAEDYLSKAYEKKGDFEAAIASLKKRKEINTELNKIISEQRLLETSAKFKLEQYQNDLERVKKEKEYSQKLIQKSKLLSYIFIGSFAILLIAFAIIFRLSKTRKRYINRLFHKNLELTQAKEEAERLSKLKTQFFSTISHELRTPLYGVIGISSILLEDKELSSHKDDLKSLKFSADYLLALINDVLTLNKIDANGVKLETTAFSLSRLLQNIIRTFNFSLEQNKNTIHLSIDKTIPDFLIGDSVRLSQILMNLVGNAVKFNENGNIWVTIKQLKSANYGTYKIHFEVKDDGIGIPKENRESIFEEFSQVQNKNYNYQGTGLGLPIVKKLLALYGSEIHLQSELGKGTSFSFAIELKANEKMEATEYPIAYQELAALESSLGQPHILVVDDNRINQKITQKILEQRNFKCALADDGEEAIEKVRNTNFDLILMDIHMPGIGGIEATKSIREFNSKTPIIALTAVEIDDLRKIILDSGMNDIILKPYDVSQFLTTILRNLTPIGSR